jgi:hypothetical protein
LRSSVQVRNVKVAHVLPDAPHVAGSLSAGTPAASNCSLAATISAAARSAAVIDEYTVP